MLRVASLRNSSGFTLVETLTALAISAFAITTLVQIFAAVSQKTGDTRARSIAEMHLSSLVAQTDILVKEGTRELTGELPGKYGWRITSAPLATIDSQMFKDIVIRRITYSLNWQEGRHAREVSLTSDRVIRP
jgi:prepilin-type N-terminal cleavage/methylation domain-containing protein